MYSPAEQRNTPLIAGNVQCKIPSFFLSGIGDWLIGDWVYSGTEEKKLLWKNIKMVERNLGTSKFKLI